MGLPEFVAGSAGAVGEPRRNVGGTKREPLADVRRTLRDMMTQSPLTAITNYVKQPEEAIPKRAEEAS